MSNEVQTPKIEKILRVVDTREFEEIGDRWVPIVGSGIEHDCSRCGRAHEIHATVLLSDGTESLVGVSCMKSESVEIAAKAKLGAGRATTISKIRSQLAALAPKYFRAILVETETAKTFVAEFRVESRVRLQTTSEIARGEAPTYFDVLWCGPVSQWLLVSKDSAELRESLVHTARAHAVSAALTAVGLRSSNYYAEERAHFERRIAKLDARAEEVR